MSKNISEDRTRRERITKEQKEQYLESLVERNVTQEKTLGIESVQVSVDIRSDEDIYYYIEIEGAIKNDIFSFSINSFLII